MRRILVVSVVSVLAFSSTGFAQQAKPDDTPSISVGVTLFSDYTYTVSPTATDSDGNKYNPSAFNVTRSYINLNGKVSHLISFRITPDISRETGAGSSLNGSLTFRVKYAFAQVNLDDYTGKGSWVRIGIQQTPWVDFQEGIYRYRFQGTVFSEREGFQSSSDAGVSYHVNLPGNYGDVHAGYYNGRRKARPQYRRCGASAEPREVGQEHLQGHPHQRPHCEPSAGGVSKGHCQLPGYDERPGSDDGADRDAPDPEVLDTQEGRPTGGV